MASKKTKPSLRGVVKTSTLHTDPGVIARITEAVTRNVLATIATALKGSAPARPTKGGKVPAKAAKAPRKVPGRRRSSSEIKDLEDAVIGVLKRAPDSRAKFIAENLGLKTGDIRQAIHGLRTAKRIEVSGGNKQGTTYRLVLEKLPTTES